MIPVVIFHVGDQDYFKKCIEINSLTNEVIIIGDNTNNTMPNHIHTNTLDQTLVNRFTKCFVNYSTNPLNYELYCFLRVFYLREMMIKNNLTKVCHLDSDCILLDNINKYADVDIAYSIQKMDNKFHMVGSIHNSILNLDFCNKFIELCFDIYENKSKFNLIKKKIKWHKKKNIAGGICDMTIYYLLTKTMQVKDINLMNDVVFDHNISSTYGYLGIDTFILNNGIKEISIIDNKYYFKTINGELKQTFSFHFQGNKKQILTQFNINI